MAFPTPRRYSKESYALSALADINAGGKKSPMYNVLVKRKKLTSNVMAMIWHRSWQVHSGSL
jgi:antitoxin component HigA of HigAB toxin-antitoxin module